MHPCVQRKAACNVIRTCSGEPSTVCSVEVKNRLHQPRPGGQDQHR